MSRYNLDYSTPIPDISVFINCDTVLAIDLESLNLGQCDEFIFTIKNYDYANAPYVFLFRARVSDADKNGEVIFKIPYLTSLQLKQSAFYNMSVIVNAFDSKKPSIYNSITANGKIILRYGLPDLTTKFTIDGCEEYEIISTRLERVNDDTIDCQGIPGGILGMRLEAVEDQEDI